MSTVSAVGSVWQQKVLWGDKKSGSRVVARSATCGRRTCQSAKSKQRRLHAVYMYVVQDLLREIKALSERALDGKYIPWRLSLLCPLTGIWSVRRSRQPRTSVDIRFFIKMYGLWHRRLWGRLCVTLRVCQDLLQR